MSMSLQDWNGLKDIQNQICWKEGETEQKATKSGCFEESEGTRQQSQKNIQAVHKTCIPYGKTDGSRMKKNLFVQHWPVFSMKSWISPKTARAKPCWSDQCLPLSKYRNMGSNMRRTVVASFASDATFCKHTCDHTEGISISSLPDSIQIYVFKSIGLKIDEAVLEHT